VQTRIITPESTVLEMEDVEHVLLPAAGGEMGVLPGHIATVVQIDVGRIQVDREGEDVEPIILATSGGFAEILEDSITVLAETAEVAEEIDVERARRARDRAEELLQRRDAKVDDASTRASLSRAINRIHVAEH
jgi:F-type H+-transporting ATPase subunit epsilon